MTCAVCGVERDRHVARGHRFHEGVAYMDDDHGLGGIGGLVVDVIEQVADALDAFTGDGDGE